MAVIGDFCGWVEPGVPMAKNADGKWEVAVKSTMDGVLKYKFWYKGTYIQDYKAPDKIDDGFGGNNGLIEVATVLAKQKAKELEASGDAAGAAALMAQANKSSGGGKIGFQTWTQVGFSANYITQAKSDATKKGIDLDNVKFSTNAYTKLVGNIVPGASLYVELPMGKGDMTLMEKDKYGETKVAFKDGFKNWAVGGITSPFSSWANPGFHKFSVGVETDYVNAKSGWKNSEIDGRSKILWPTISGWNAGYDVGGGFVQFTNGNAVRQIGDATVNFGLIPNKTGDRKGNKYGFIGYADVEVAGITADVQYNAVYGTETIFKDVFAQNVVLGAKGKVGSVNLAGQALMAFFPKDMQPGSDELGYSSFVTKRTKEFNLKDMAFTAKADWANDVLELSGQYRVRGAEAELLYVKDNDGEGTAVQDALGQLNSQSIIASAKYKGIYGVDLGLYTTTTMRLEELKAADMVGMTADRFKFAKGAEFDIKPTATFMLLDLVGFDATVDMYTNLYLSTLNDKTTFKFNNFGLKAGIAALNDVVKGIDVMYGLKNDDAAKLYNSVVTTVKLPSDINVDVAFALRSIKDTEEGKKLVKEEAIPFGFGVGVSKVLKNLQQPTAYAQFVFNADPYKGFSDGRQNLNMDGYLLSNYGNEGNASFRVGMAWNIQ